MNLPIQIDEMSREPIYHQIEVQLKSLILAGQLVSGDALPSIRALAKDLACSVITTRRAYQNLEAAGYIKTLRGKGTFVNELDKNKQKETKISVVREALQKAIEQGLAIGCSEEELREVFISLLSEIKD